MCKEMNVESVLKALWIRSSRCANFRCPEKLDMSFCNMVVDSAITSLSERFHSLDVRDEFRVLFHCKEISFDALTTQVSGAEHHVVQSQTLMERNWPWR
ncbi:hypothetical protein Hamer_G009182 [Homarus americanus]|uniref:Uncharacterized protein n=1 Tax=Homarus americanus TaxID=6706 RepID=A0A8J5NBD7_HOMAM|nr:hypothetical protein Hamer_G009182 [Homarus americanus]